MPQAADGDMEQQSRWSEQRSERREQVVQQQESVQRTEHHYTRQMMTQQRGQLYLHTTPPLIPLHTLTYFDLQLNISMLLRIYCVMKC